ncbi:MAG TPA: MbcA/ParS/Xre antitoxin family protein [Thiobacillaceae bacterium]|nr:MbcA/ParS/Xre antitoxin family protein [Thiobacillaceae bacterium]
MSLAAVHAIDQADVLSESLINVGRQLGLSQADLGEVVGKDRTAISRGRIDPDSKAGELALLLIRCYRALYALVGGDPEHMRHWMHTENLHTGGVPAEQIKRVQGLVTVLEYLDAMRGKL